MKTFRDYALGTTRIMIPQPPPPVADPADPGVVRFNEIAQAMVSQPETVIHASFAEAHAAMRQNRLRGRHDKPTTGRRGDRFRRHIAYAWAPSRRKVGKDWVLGPVCLHVYHACKGWKIHHGLV